MYGTPKGLASVNIYSAVSGHMEDHLITAFDTGKIVLSRFNSASEGFETVFMFNVEEDAAGPGSELKAKAYLFERAYGSSSYPKIAADPSGKVLSAIVYGRSCLFVPLQTRVIDKQLPALEPFLIDLAAVGLPCVIYDLCYLSG